MSKAMRNVKKVADKINHSSKLRTNIQAQMAVGESLIVNRTHCGVFTIFFDFSWPTTRSAARSERHQHRRFLQGLQRTNEGLQRRNSSADSRKLDSSFLLPLHAMLLLLGLGRLRSVLRACHSPTTSNFLSKASSWHSTRRDVPKERSRRQNHAEAFVRNRSNQKSRPSECFDDDGADVRDDGGRREVVRNRNCEGSGPC